MATDTPALEVEGLGFRYPGAPGVVLDDLSLRVQGGERVALLGPNGSGKTTFVLHLNGLIERQVGSVTVGGLLVEDVIGGPFFFYLVRLTRSRAGGWA